MAVSVRGGSSKSNRFLLVSNVSPTLYHASWRVVLAHLSLGSGSTSASACTDSASDSTDFVSESFDSYESKLSYEED
jgi:hypothetical protein